MNRQKEATINDFIIVPEGVSIITQGLISIENDKRINDIYLNSIWDFLMKEAVKHCKYHPSDLMYDYVNITEDLNKKEICNRSYLLGFREHGVDSTLFVLAKHGDFNTYKNENNQIYEKIYKLDVELKPGLSSYNSLFELTFSLYDVTIKLYEVKYKDEFFK